MKKHYLQKTKRIAAFTLLLISTAFPLQTLGNPNVENGKIDYLKTLSIEELLQTEVTTASKKEETLFEVPAAISVITAEDIRRSGSRTIPDALRLVPGVQVASIDGSRWAVSIRGFADYFANKLLVLIDGRSVYTPLFSGVYWNAQDTLLEDIDRIELIRGPGATIWGANAVNGVINIITKKAEDTQGLLLVAEAGTLDEPMAAARYGGRFGETGFYRIFAKGFNRDDFKTLEGDDANDSWSTLRSGFTAEWQGSDADDFMVQGEIYEGEADVTFELSGFTSPPFQRVLLEDENYDGGHILTRWKHTFSESSESELQIYYNRTCRDQVVAAETRDTIDLEYKHRWKINKNNDLIMGLGYRWSEDDIEGTINTSFIPDSRDDSLYSGFLQDEIMLVPEKLWLTIGSKFEHNDYSGFEIQPSIRARFSLNDKQTYWAAISRAVRTPSRADHNLVTNLATVAINPATNIPFNNGALSLIRILGDEGFESEELISYEAGFRWQPAKRLSLDLSVFYNDYDNLRTTDRAASFFEFTPDATLLVIPQVISNNMEGNTYGAEIQANLQVTKQMRLNGSYSLLEMDLEFTDQFRTHEPNESKLSPQHQVNLRGSYDFTSTLSLDLELYYVSELDDLVDSYFRVDSRLSWRPTDYLEISLNGENLFDDQHQEFIGQSGIVPSEVPRVATVKAVYSF